MRKILITLVVVCLLVFSFVSCKAEIKPPTFVNGTYVFTEASFKKSIDYAIKEGFITAKEASEITYDIFRSMMLIEEGIDLESFSLELKSDNTLKTSATVEGLPVSVTYRYYLEETEAGDLDVYCYVSDIEYSSYFGTFIDGNINYLFDEVEVLFLEKK